MLIRRFIVPYFYLPEHMLSHNYNEEDSAFIISAIGVFNTIGMIGLGYIGDQPWLSVPKAFSACLFGKFHSNVLRLRITNYD